MKADSGLIEKYNVAGPRYTSYPTVPYWETAPTEQAWIQSVARALKESEEAGIGASFYIHIPFCKSICTYCGCNTRLTMDRSVISPYLHALLSELDIYLSRLGRGGSALKIPLAELHIGGGSPSFLSADDLNRFLNEFLSRIRVMDSAELSIEMDPRTTTREQLTVLIRHGFRRLSLGVQDFDPAVQNFANRVQSEELVEQVTMTARELGIENVNFDLIYGLPLQTSRSISQTMSAVRRIKPDRIAFYAHAHVPWMKAHQRGITEEVLPSAEQKRSLYEFGRSLLEDAGYREIGMDHFASERDPLWLAYLDGSLHRNFMGYTPRQVAPLIGLGVSAIGDSWRMFSQNEKILEDYQSKILAGHLPLAKGHVLSGEDKILRKHILNIMTRFETSWDNSDSYLPFLDGIAERLSEMVKDGLVALGPNSCRVEEAGRPFLRNVCMAFDARLFRKHPSTPTFSSTI